MNNEKYISDFISQIERVVSLSFEEKEFLHKISTVRSYDKNEVIIRQNHISCNEIFVVEGIVRGYYNTYNGKEVNVEFFQGPSVTAPWFTRTFNNVSSINYQTLTNSVLIEIDANDFEALMRTSPAMYRWATGITQSELMRKTNREILLLTKSAEERFQVFRQMFAALENHIPLTHIASYLGITPVSLSRLRGKK